MLTVCVFYFRPCFLFYMDYKSVFVRYMRVCGEYCRASGTCVCVQFDCLSRNCECVYVVLLLLTILLRQVKWWLCWWQRVEWLFSLVLLTKRQRGGLTDMSWAQAIRSSAHTLKSHSEASVCSVSGRIMGRRVYQTAISVFLLKEGLNLSSSFCKH